MSEAIATNETILVVGGGISGLTAALEAAECGKQVLLLEKSATVGGRVGQLYKYFPKLCYPTCGLEIQYRRLKANKNVRLITMAEVTGISGDAGNYSVDVKVSPRYVTENCTACGECGNAVEAEFDDEHNYGMMKRKGAYLPSKMAYPQRYVIDPAMIGSDDVTKAKEACKYDAVDLDMAEENMTINVGAIIWSTGWKPYDANKVQAYGYDRYDNVITNVEFERMMDPFGPTGGKIQRADGSTPKNIAFIQCAGSRDKNHLEHCSRICCMASLKQTTYVAEQLGDDCKSSIYYIDIRAIDRIDDFHQNVKADENVSFIKSKVANIVRGESGNVVLHGVDTEGYNRYANDHDLVVLATGMQSTVPADIFPEGTVINKDGFIDADESNGGIFGAGCSSDALDVNRAAQNATAAALRAIQVVSQVSGTEG